MRAEDVSRMVSISQLYFSSSQIDLDQVDFGFSPRIVPIHDQLDRAPAGHDFSMQQMLEVHDRKGMLSQRQVSFSRHQGIHPCLICSTFLQQMTQELWNLQRSYQRAWKASGKFDWFRHVFQAVFFPWFSKAETVSTPVNAWKNRRPEQILSVSDAEISCTVIYFVFFPTPNWIQRWSRLSSE